jgi:hypothetical protein
VIKVGDILTVDNEIFSIGGRIILAENERVEVRELWISEGRWSRLCPDIWIPEKLNGVMLVGKHGIWQPEIFKELKIN